MDVNEAVLPAYTRATSKLGLELYDESLCAERWSAAYYKLNQRIYICESMPDDSPLEITQLSSPKKGPYLRYLSLHVYV